MPVITNAGEYLITQQQQAGQPLIIDKMILANVAGLDSNATPSRAEGMPALADVKITKPITKDGLLNSNTVVYSTVFPSTDGTFDFNWMGLYSSVHDVIVAIAYVPLQTKIKTVGTDIGNVITKNFAIEFTAAADITGINISAESWQIDYTARLMSMDKHQRDMARNIYGRSTFLNDGFKVKHDTGKYYLSAGKAILGGINFDLPADVEIVPGTLPQTLWIDAYQETSMMGVLNKYEVVLNDGTAKTDYVLGSVEHILVRVGVINSSVSIDDNRDVVCSDFSLVHSNTFEGLSDAVAFVTASPHIFTNVHTRSFRNKKECADLEVDYPDGGHASYEVGEDFGVDDGGSVFDAGSLQLRLLFSGLYVNALNFGIYEGSTTAFSYLKASADFARSKKLNKVLVNCNVVSENDNQNTFADIIFFGNGSIEGIYRKSVFRESGSLVSDIGQNISGNKLNELNESGSPVCVLVGDSIATFSANTKSRYGMLSDALEYKLRSEFDGVNYYNRAIGGQTFTTLDSIPNIDLYTVDWYVNHSIPWLDYIEQLSPDVVFLSFGMNDAEIINIDKIDSIVSKINNFSKKPSIVFITNLTPSLSGRKQGDFATRSEQESRDYAAGFVRTYADFYGYGLIDFNRKHSLIRDGIDCLSGAIGDRKSMVKQGNSNIGQDETYSFKIRLNINTDLIPSNSPNEISIRLDSTGKSVLKIKNFEGNYRFSVLSGSAQSVTRVISINNTSEAVPSLNDTLHVECAGSKLTIYRRDVSLGSHTPPLITVNTIRGGGFMVPRVDYSVDGLVTDAVIDRVNPFVSIPVMSDSTLWGCLDEPDSTGKWGGSAWNHPSTFISTAVYKPILDAISFRQQSKNLITISDLIHSTAELVSNNLDAIGKGVSYYLDFPSSVISTASFVIREAVFANYIEIIHISDDSGQTGISADISVSILENNKGFSRTPLSVGTSDYTINSTKIVKTIIPTFAVSITSGSQLSITRNAVHVTDNYGELKIIGIRIY